jgi:hypothetical protein
MVSSGGIGLHRCPNSGLVIESMGSDDKAMCGCGKPNPKVPTEIPGLHVKRFLASASVDEYIRQEEKRRSL